MDYRPQPNRYVNKVTRRDIRERQPEPVRLELVAQAVLFGGAFLVAGALLSGAGRGV